VFTFFKIEKRFRYFRGTGRQFLFILNGQRKDPEVIRSADHESVIMLVNCNSRAVASGGGSGARPPFEIGAPPFHVWPLGCCMLPILYFKNVAPFWFLTPSFVFLPPLLLNPGDGPV